MTTNVLNPTLDTASAHDSFAGLVFADPARARAADGAPPAGIPASWAIQDNILRDLWQRNLSPDLIGAQLNRSVPAIMTRAARLGLPRRAAPGRKRVLRSPDEVRVRQTERSRTRSAELKEALAPKEGVATRVCLMCVAPFQSQGRHNRICPKCKGSTEYEAGARLPDLDFGDMQG